MSYTDGTVKAYNIVHSKTYDDLENRVNTFLSKTEGCYLIGGVSIDKNNVKSQVILFLPPKKVESPGKNKGKIVVERDKTLEDELYGSLNYKPHPEIHF
jgi:hypothetical protein